MKKFDSPSRPPEAVRSTREKVGDVGVEANFKKNVAQELREAQEKGELPPVELEFFLINM